MVEYRRDIKRVARQGGTRSPVFQLFNQSSLLEPTDALALGPNSNTSDLQCGTDSGSVLVVKWSTRHSMPDSGSAAFLRESTSRVTSMGMSLKEDFRAREINCCDEDVHYASAWVREIKVGLGLLTNGNRTHVAGKSLMVVWWSG